MIKDLFHRLYLYKRRTVFCIKESLDFRNSIIPEEYIIRVKPIMYAKKPIIETPDFWLEDHEEPKIEKTEEPKELIKN